MKITVEAMVIRFQGQIEEVTILNDMYTETSIVIEPNSHMYSYIGCNLGLYKGDKYILEEYIKPSILNNEPIHLSGEAKDIGFDVGEFTSGIESKEVDWLITA